MPDDRQAPIEYDQHAGWIRKIVQQAQLVWRLFWDRRVPLWAKAIPALSFAYLVWPIDLIAGIPGVSAADDLAVILLGFKVFVDVCPPEVVREHMTALLSRPSAEWEVVDGQELSSSSRRGRREPPAVDGDFEEVT